MRTHAPRTSDEAMALLAASPEALCIAGGASLVAKMNAGLVNPTVLVSLQSVGDLAGIARLANGVVRVGAMARHAEIAATAAFQHGQTVVSAAAAVIANPVVRNMGTIGGSLAFADPAADYPAALAACDATVDIASAAGQRQMPVGAFFAGRYTTALGPGEIIRSITVPPAPLGSIGLYRKLSRTRGDYAIASVALVLAMQGDVVSHFACAIGGCGPTPVRLPAVEAMLVGGTLPQAALLEAGEALAEACDPTDDIRASAAYRRTVVPRLLASTVAEARQLLGTPHG